jgi:hypothetical protein
MSEKHHLLAWILSFETARVHYPNTSLVTDDEGKRMLVDGIGLEFDLVYTDLNALQDHDPGWWALGKAYAYRLQTEPFVHIDSDVFIWKRLPDTMETAPVFAQSPEPFVVGNSWYRPELFENIIGDVEGGWIPKEWEWSRSTGQAQKAACCGIMGGNRVDFISYYADQAIKLIEHPPNNQALSLLDDKVGHNILFEQYLLSVCVEFHKNKTSPYKGIDIEYLFDSPDDAFSSDKPAKIGYSHMIGGAKRNALLCERLERRVQQDYPHYYERCLKYLSDLD